VVDGIIDGTVSLYRSALGALGSRRTERIPASAVGKAPPAAGPAPASTHPAAHPVAGPGQLAVAHPAPGQPPGQRPITPVAALHPADPATATLSVSLSMDRAPHILTFKVVDGRAEVVLASDRAEYLQTVTGAALYEEEHGEDRKDLIDRLERIESRLSELKFSYRAAEDDRSQRGFQSQISRRLEEIAEDLTWIGTRFNIKTLHDLHHASQYVLPGGLLREPYASDVRAHFYPSGYVLGTRAWKRTELNRLTQNAPPDQFWDESSKTWEPRRRPSASGQQRADSNVTIDHQPRVMEHWNGQRGARPAGRNTDQDERSRFYNDTSAGKLQLVSWRNNSIDGALARATVGGYQKTVGKDFKGPDDEP
jgi:hypothetical protein